MAALGIVSLGKLMGANWPFYFESADSLVAVTADEQSHFKVELGDDDNVILHLPQDMSRFWIEKGGRKRQNNMRVLLAKTYGSGLKIRLGKKKAHIFPAFPTPLLNPEP